jgi:hypothetical protein
MCHSGDSPYSVDAIYDVQPGEDWLDKARAAQAAKRPRIFVIGATRVQEDESTIGQPLAEIKPLLEAMYPEVKHATVREATANGVTTVEFLPKPGRKG